jgi:hypothetical protein
MGAGMWTWVRAHGDKALAGVLTTLTATDGFDPTLLLWMGTEGKRWVAFALSVAILAHVTLMAPNDVRPAPLPPPPVPPTRHSGHARLSHLVVMALFAAFAVAGALAIHWVHRADCPTRSKPLPELIRPAPSGEPQELGLVTQP